MYIGICLFSILALYSCENKENETAKFIDGNWDGEFITIPKALNQELPETFVFHHENEYTNENEGILKARVSITKHFKNDTSVSILKEVFGELEFIIVLEKDFLADYWAFENEETGLWIAYRFDTELLDAFIKSPLNINFEESKIINFGTYNKEVTESDIDLKKRILTRYIESTRLYEGFNDFISYLYRHPMPFKQVDENSYTLGDTEFSILFKKN